MALELTFKKKDGGEKKPSGQKNDVILKIMSVFEKNPFLKILVPLLLFLIIAAILVFVIFGDGVLTGKNEVPPDQSQNVIPTNEVDVLPHGNDIENEDIVSLIEQDPLSEDILSTAAYKGYVTGSSGLKTALIQMGNSSDKLVLTVGDTVGDSKWELAEITSEYVIFKAGDKTKKLEIKH